MEAPNILYKDAYLIALNKPAGMMVHPVKGHKEKGLTVSGWASEQFPEIRNVGDDPELRPGIVHRLDRDTSGVLIVARTQEAFAYLKNLFQAHAIVKQYLALVVGIPKEREGIIDKPIRLVTGTTRRTVWGKGTTLTKEARTTYKTLKTFSWEGHSFALLAVIPLTGRTHQIRVHLNAIGHPVLGDKLYGGSVQRSIAEKIGLTRQFLHAETISFTNVDGKHLTVSAGLPPELEQVLHRLSLEM